MPSRLILAISLLLALCGAGCADDPAAPTPAPEPWTWLHPPVGRGAALADVWAESADRAVAVGQRGLIVVAEGGVCRQVESGVTADLNAVWQTAPGRYLAVGRDGTALTGDGESWAPAPSPGADYTLAGLWPLGPDTLVATGFSLTAAEDREDIRRRRPAAAALLFDGTNWTSLPPVNVYGGFSAVAGTGPDDLHFGFATSPAYLYGPDGWSTYSMGTNDDGFGTGVYGLWARPDGAVFAVGNGGQVRCRDDGQWASLNLEEYVTLYDVWAPDHDTVWVGGSYGRGFAARHDGEGWHRETDLGHATVAALHGTSPDDLFAVGAYGLFLQRDAAGWRPVNGVTANDLTRVWPLAADDYLMGGGDGLFRWDGRELRPQDCGLTSVRGIWAAGPDEIYVAGVASQTAPSGLVRFDGASWRSEALVEPLVAYVDAVAGAATGEAAGALYASAGNRILRRTAGEWEVAYAPEETVWWPDLAVFPDGRVVARASRRWVAIFDGAEWALHESGTEDGLTAMWAADADHVWVGTSRGAILTNAGGAWHQAAQLSVTGIDALWGRGPADVTAAAGTRWLHFDGTEWREGADRPPVPILDACPCPDGSLLAVGYGGAVLRGRGGAAP